MKYAEKSNSMTLLINLIILLKYRFDSIRSRLRKVERTITRQDIVSLPAADLNSPDYSVPTLAEMGYTEQPTHPFPGGETEALRRMRETVLSRPGWVASFAKPDTSPNSLQPSTTVLSPYLKTGCLSSLYMYEELEKIYSMYAGKHTLPPVSLHGQVSIYLNSEYC